jgi:SlyX protein
MSGGPIERTEPIERADAIERLETKLAYLERANHELSDVVYRQQREIQGLRAKFDSLVDRVSSLSGSSEEGRTPEDERPPHY